MPKSPRKYEDEGNRLARERSQARAKLVKAGILPGLFETGTKALRPEIKALIDAALAKKARR